MKQILLILLATTLLACTPKKSPEQKKADLRDSVLNLTYDGKPSPELNQALDTLLTPVEASVFMGNMMSAIDDSTLMVGKTYGELIR